MKCEHEWVQVGSIREICCKWCRVWMPYPDLTLVDSCIDFYWELNSIGMCRG